MARKRGRGAPKDPQQIVRERLERDAERRAAERAAGPEAWGVSAEMLALATSADVDGRVGARGRVIHARRSDPFDLLHAAGGLSDYQHQAARRLMRDVCERAGVQTADRPAMAGRIDPEAGRGLTERLTQRMVDAGRRVAFAMQRVGPANARVLRALIEPMVAEGRMPAWRETVRLASGETDRHTQGAVVRQACENLRLVYGIGPMEPPAAANDDAAQDVA